MKRPIYVWLLFALCAALLLAVMAWLTSTVLDLERDRASRQQQAAFEETVRLAMWRMDSALTPIVGAENTRPYFEYSTFYPSGRAYTRMFARLESGDVLFPSALLADDSPHVLLYFQVGPDGVLTSPQAPSGNMRDLAESGYLSHSQVQQASDRLRQLDSLLDREALAMLLPEPKVPERGRPATLAINNPLTNQAKQGLASSPQQQEMLSANEFNARRQVFNQAANLSNNASMFDDDGEADVVPGTMHPVWMGDALLLVRMVLVGREEYVQGCWLDWAALRVLLEGAIQDLLPEAKVAPVIAVDQGESLRTLAALPLKLDAVPPPVVMEGGPTPIQLSLLIGWICVVLATIAAGALLGGALALSERRSAFVSAVTHELRTPLTTFRLYTEMLSEGMVDEQGRQRYLGTLRTEAERLAHLVENVLAYARLERNRAGGAIEEVPVSELLDRVGGRLADRAAQAGMTVEIVNEAGPEVAALIDLSAVERVLYNLVDNACKYAGDADDTEIGLTIGTRDGLLSLRVSDSGPGVTAADRGRLFKPFSKSATVAANTKPGVGLGLTLSRRLARKMGGELRLLERDKRGASFELALPLSQGRQS